MNECLIALAQINPTVGALESNSNLIIQAIQQAIKAGAHLVVLPELCVSGYPPEDLVLKKHFLADCQSQVQRIAASIPPEVIAIVGSPALERSQIHNTAQILHRGRIAGSYAKMCLPNYGVFDEKRVFNEGSEPCVLEVGPFRVGIHICEDSWSTRFPTCTRLKDAGLDAVVNLSASPYYRGKEAHRRQILAATAIALKAPLLYCNLVGGQDELVFDGRSLVINAKGKTLSAAAVFEPDIMYYPITARERTATISNYWKTVSLPFPTIGKTTSAPATARQNYRPASADDALAEVYMALSLGLSDYVNKNGFKKVVVAISGGIDSALVAAIAVDALGADRVIGITMPSRFSSKGTYSDAGEIARRLGIQFHDVSIRNLHEQYLKELTDLWPGRTADTTEENIQARIRGTIVMALSNKFGWLVLTTGNKSELATGYCTLYGDMAGGFALIKDVPKTLVFDLCRWRNAQTGDTPPIPESIITRPPSAELRANQKDQDSLPPYAILDGIIERYVEKDESADEIVSAGFARETVARVIKLIDGNEYKRRQGPPGVKITPKSFGRDRRLPITNSYDERVKNGNDGNGKSRMKKAKT